MASLADLPQELVDQIISELRGDTRSLRTCALISPSFLPWSRQRLFSSVRVTASNLHAFGKLIESSPTVASYIHLLDIPKMDFSAILSVSLLTLLPNLTHLVTHCDPVDFRHLSPTETKLLAGAAAHLTSVHVLIDRLWTLPAWAALLNTCPALTNLAVQAEANGWGIWTADDVAPPMPMPTGDSVLRLHSLHISGDCKILSPLGAWLLPQRALAGLQTLVLDVDYLLDDYTAPDKRLPLVRAAQASLCELTLGLDPPMPLSLGSEPNVPPLCVASSFPHLRTLHITDGPDAEISASLAWLATFLEPTAAALGPPTALQRGYGENSILEKLSIDHNMVRRDLFAVPATTWRALEDALLGVGTPNEYAEYADVTAGGVDADDPARCFDVLVLAPPSTWALSSSSSSSSPASTSTAPTTSTYTPLPPTTATTLKSSTPTAYPLLRTLTFTGYQKFSFGALDAFEHFSKTVKERLPRLVGRGILVVRQ